MTLCGMFNVMNIEDNSTSSASSAPPIPAVSSSPNIGEIKRKMSLSSSNGNGHKTVEVNGSESPKLGRRWLADSVANGTSRSSDDAGISSSNMEAFKQEILDEMRKEIQKAKQEIIEGT
ncbi:vasodilator-stimulated phosphoprotein-like [Lingula anatina]|uniref:Vasodilator-stimulated phosphoprotein-like n=1 Tax=Lingula anatina TaxID=7574 RepID=A0A1S3HT55_LINAN|nr:vasodilator-stimulated phosphoprotein-like [Lingula anatina]|eukprot:XP_013389220.2 vasodilator-stimulated phosphoprotein-like [Lingula anatina]